ncbi:MAG TPA: peptide-methionine (S)-S-oxide reductase MsrA [Alphaproteobacteria bacterium]|nr:peptide-methionine (S)-S-oxide reductase MsrA [Alphaproteobacteria bacterium]
MEKAMFGAGCFWGVEAAFRKVPGVTDVAVGYSGGKTENPTYQDVCSHTTGHAEVVLVEFDPAQVSFEQLCELFFTIHDPTQLNRQGPDVGDQYRSAIFTFSDEQLETAKAVRDKLETSGRFRDEIVTQIAPASKFWRAEDYHQRYFEKHGVH